MNVAGQGFGGVASGWGAHSSAMRAWSRLIWSTSSFDGGGGMRGVGGDGFGGVVICGSFPWNQGNAGHPYTVANFWTPRTARGAVAP